MFGPNLELLTLIGGRLWHKQLNIGYILILKFNLIMKVRINELPAQ